MNVTAMTSGLTRGLDQVKQEVDTKMRDIAAGAAAMLGTFARFGQGFLRGGLNQAAQFEQTTIKMETMLGSTEETKKTLAELTDFAVKTPFEMPGILQVATGMIQFGERGDELIDTMKVLGDASGGDAQQFQLLGLVLNQVRGVGKLLTQDFRQLSTRGIISLQDIADYFKVTTAEAQNMLSSGKVSFEDTKKMLKGLTEEGGRYYKMSEKQSQSLTGLISTLSDAWNILKRQMAQSLIPVVKILTGTIIKVLDVAGELSLEVKAMASSAMVGATAFAMLGASIFGAIAASRLFGISLKKALIGSGVGLVVIALGAAVGLLVKWFTSSAAAAEAFKDVLASLQAVWQRITEFATNFFAALQDFIESRKEKFVQMGDTMVEIFRNLWDIAKEVFSSLLSLSESVLSEIGTLFNNMFGTSYESGWQFFDAMIDRLNEFLEWVSLMTTNWRLTWELMKTNTAIALVTMADKALMFFNTFKSFAIASAKGMLTAMQDAAFNIGLAFQTVIASIKGMFKGLWAGLKNKFKGGSFLDSFKETYDKERAKVEKSFRPIGQNSAEVFNEAFVANMGKDSPLKDTLDELKMESDRIKGEMQDAQDLKRKQRLDEKVPDWQGPKLPEKETKKEEAAAIDDYKMELEAGRYGFAEAGSKIQDSLLKDKDDEQKKQTGLLEAGVKKQDEVIKAVKESGTKPAVLTE